jgi:hypothetical protein
MKEKILFLLLVVYFVVTQSYDKFICSPGIDFYHFWGISKAHLWSTDPLGNPYTHQAQYAASLNAHAEDSEDARLKTVNVYRRTLQLTGTPLCYAVFGFLPKNYSNAFSLFQIAQVLLFISSVLMLGWLFRADFLWISMFALLLTVKYDPFLSDLLVGNVNAIQFFVVVVIMVFIERWPAAGSTDGQFCRSTLLLFALVALSLFKPNLMLITLFLAAHLWARQGTRAFALAALASAALCVALVIFPCLSFHSWTVWQDWYYLGLGGNYENLAFPVKLGNFASVPIFSELLGIPLVAVIAGMAAALVLSVVVTLGWVSANSRSGLRNIWSTAVLSIQDPHLMAAAAIVATFALAPLLWLHYYTVLLFPISWLLWSKRRWSYAIGMGVISILMIAFQPIYVSLELLFAIPYSYALSWVPLWIAVLAEMALHNQDYSVLEKA